MYKKTISEFTHELMESYSISESHFNNIRKKIERKLKDENYWENAEIKIIGKNKTKIFPNVILDQIKLEIEAYLIKKSDKINANDYFSFKNKVNFYNDNKADIIDEEHEFFKNYEENPYHIAHFAMSKNEELELMIKALFYMHFEKIDKNQYQQDNYLIAITEDDNSDNIDFYTALKRFKNPIESYCIKKERD